MRQWLTCLLLVAGCGETAPAPLAPLSAWETAVMGYMPFVWADRDGVMLAAEVIQGDRRSVRLSRFEHPAAPSQSQPLLAEEPFVSHPSAVTLADGSHLMHAIVKRNGRYRIAQVEEPQAPARLLPLTDSSDAVAPFARLVGTTLYLCWTRLDGNQARIQLTRSTDNGKTWAPSQDVARGQIGRMAVLPDGRLWVVYQTQPGDGGILEIFSLEIDPRTGQATHPRRITHLGNSHDPWPWLQQGTRHLAFAGSRGEPFQIYETTSRNGQTWTAPRALTQRARVMHVQPHVLPLADGRTLWSWGEGPYPNGPFRIHTAIDL